MYIALSESKNRRDWCGFAALLLALLVINLCVVKNAQASTQTQHLYHLGRVNQLNISEPAGAHPAGRTSLSWTLESWQAKQEQGQNNGRGSAANTFKNQLLLTKGLVYPLDFGLAIAEASNYNGQPHRQMGTYLQWTIFESFALPALSIRSKWARLNGAGIKTFETRAIEALLSWGYGRIRFFTGAQMSRHSFVAIKSGANSKFSSGPLDHRAPRPTKANFNSFDYHWGVHLQIFPGSLAMAADLGQQGDSKQYRGKMTYEF